MGIQNQREGDRSLCGDGGMLATEDLPPQGAQHCPDHRAVCGNGTQVSCHWAVLGSGESSGEGPVATYIAFRIGLML